MAFRTVLITSHSKLEYSLNYLVFKTVNETKRINLSEIHTLIIESTAVSITSALLVELSKRKIKIIFCDEKKNPNCEVIPYYGDSISSRRITEQIQWEEEFKSLVWSEIIKEKIKNQAYVLKKVSCDDSKILENFAFDVVIGDITNREGHAAKYYFNRVFGKEFNRNSNDRINAYLNYGYSLILSQFNKAIVSKGYLTQLGIHHKNEFNQFNLSCDLMEPFRPIIDNVVMSLSDDNFKEELVKLLSSTVNIGNQNQTIVNAIQIYTNSVFKALNSKDISQIKFFKFYE